MRRFSCLFITSYLKKLLSSVDEVAPAPADVAADDVSDGAADANPDAVADDVADADAVGAADDVDVSY